MGCDIHCYIEKKSTYSDSGWDLWAEVDGDRNYSLFGAMAGVRHDDLAHVEPRGIPKDADYSTKEKHESWGCDAHSASWLTTAEFEAAIAVYLQANGYQVTAPKLMDTLDASPIERSNAGAAGWIAEYWAMLASMRCFEAQGIPARLVFWFDN